MSNNRPEYYADWALEDIIDPIDKQNNKYRPPDNYRRYGWSYQESVGRNWINDLFSINSKWVRYLDDPGVVTIATLPDVTLTPIGKTLFVSDLAGGGYLAFNNGTNWINLKDGSIIN
jgi:hypothetical protein